MSKHTPGPWVFPTKRPAGDIGLTIWANNDRGPVCHIYPDFVGKNCRAVLSAEQWANVRLIAAAPELLEACELALSALEAIDDADGPSVWASERATLAAAIKKAKGG